MLKQMTTDYQETARRGPTIPDEKEEAGLYKKELNDVIAAVLKDKQKDEGFYSASDLKLFFWYRTLFLSRDKPTTHILALAETSKEELVAHTPKTLGRLIQRMKEKLLVAESEDSDAVPG